MEVETINTLSLHKQNKFVSDKTKSELKAKSMNKKIEGDSSEIPSNRWDLREYPYESQAKPETLEDRDDAS